ncbi:MAG: amidophosphoribosyltransferase [Planctomycetes bacterium]|nr:amidophosphoribosyltransferase [Planctomycetota bacterium]
MSGIFAVASRGNCMEELFYGTDYHSHLGTEFGGLAIRGVRIHREIHRIAHGQFKNLFDGFAHKYAGEMGVGVISDFDPQPIVVESRFGAFALVTTGLITNGGELSRRLVAQGVTFSEILNGRLNQTELIANLIVQAEDIVRGIENVFDRIEGSISLLLMTEEGIYAACDHHSRFPLALGTKDGVVAAASETCAFPNLGIEVEKQLQAGEMVFFDSGGVRDLVGGRDAGKSICSFLWIYTGYPASSYEGVSAEQVRERCGQALARKDSVEADLVCGVPDSGTGHAIGYAMESGLPFRRPLVKYSAGYGRSYTPPSQEVRDQIAKMKLMPIEDICRGSRLIVCEDSIVRGTQLKNLTIQKLWDAGAEEVHIRVACPPLMFPCRYNLSTRSTEELAARRAIAALEDGAPEDISEYLDASSEKHGRMVEWIRKYLGCTSLTYLTLEEMMEAIGLPDFELCACCWAGYDESASARVVSGGHRVGRS